MYDFCVHFKMNENGKLFTSFYYKMPDWTPFENHVQEEKQKRLSNEFGIIENLFTFENLLSKPERSKILPEEVSKFFASKNYQITPETMREAMYVAWMSNDALSPSGSYPDISEKNIEQHLDKFSQSFSSPLELTQSIGDYVKSNMSYDLLSYMEQRDTMLGDTEMNFDGAIDKVAKIMNLTEAQKLKIALIYSKEDVLATLLNLYAEGEKLDLSDQQMDNMKPVLQNLWERFKIVQNQVSVEHKQRYSQLLRGFNEVQKGVQAHDKEQIINAFACTPNLSKMVLAQAIHRDIDLELKQKASINEYLKDMKTGVCRHFSLIAKMLYNRLKDRVVWNSESELLYVVQHGKDVGHAYNLLMRTEKWPDGKEVIKKQYFDITSYIGWGSILKQEGKFFGSDKETRVNNSLQNHLKIIG